MSGKVKAFGPVRLRREDLAATRPLRLDQVKLSPSGQLGHWQLENAKKTVPHLIHNLVSTGALANLQDLGTEKFEFKGMWFSDSDIYKSLEALCWSLLTYSDAEQSDFLKEATDAIASAQQSDGYVNTWFQGVHPELIWKNFAMGHEMYTAGHLIQAAVAESRILPTSPLLGIACKFADLLVSKFGGSNEVKMCGHPEIETALIELYRETGEKNYLDLAEKMILARGHGTIEDASDSLFHFGPSYMQDHKPVKEAVTAVGHSVRQVYLNAGVMDLYLERGDKELLAAQEAMWEDMVYTKMYVTGGLGSRHKDEAFGDSFELPNDRAYAETCASIANFMWSWRLLLATGKGRYAEVMELSLYNIIAGSVSSDACKFLYSNPLQYRKGHFVAFDTDASERLSWYRCSCCPPNLGRIAATFQHYLFTEEADSIALHLYSASNIQAELENGTAISLSIETDYPNDGHIKIKNESAGSFGIKLRIPEWCKSFALSLNGNPLKVEADQNGYVHVQRNWTASDELILDLEMKPELLRPHPRIDASRGCVALRQGPVMYAIEQADVKSDLYDLEDFVISTEIPVEMEMLDIPGYGVVRGLRLSGHFNVVESDAEYAYQDEFSTNKSDQTAVSAIPYSLWGNREKGGMRVWIPANK